MCSLIRGVCEDVRADTFDRICIWGPNLVQRPSTDPDYDEERSTEDGLFHGEVDSAFPGYGLECEIKTGHS